MSSEPALYYCVGSAGSRRKGCTLGELDGDDGSERIACPNRWRTLDGVPSANQGRLARLGIRSDVAGATPGHEHAWTGQPSTYLQSRGRVRRRLVAAEVLVADDDGVAVAQRSEHGLR